MPKILVLCVDRDDDLGRKVNVKGPIIGKEKNILAAQKLLLNDPGESDGNTIFEAVKALKENKDAVDVVTITGHGNRGYKADTNIRKQLDQVLKRYKKVSGVMLVTDGADDDQIIPVIQSRTKVLSTRKCVVKQAQQLEKSYYVIKEAIKDPHVARVLFGLPGLILLVVGLFQDLGIKIMVLLIGLYLMVKGFGIEDPIINSFRGFRKTTSIERASFPLYVGAVFMLILAFWGGYEKAAALGSTDNILLLGASFADGFISLFVVAFVLFLIGRVGDMHYRKEVMKIKKYGLSLVTALALWVVIWKASALILGNIMLDEFIGFVILAFFGTIIGLALVREIYARRYIISKLAKDMEVFDIEGNKLGVLSEISKKKKHIGVASPIGDRWGIKFSSIVLVKPEENFVIARNA